MDHADDVRQFSAAEEQVKAALDGLRQRIGVPDPVQNADLQLLLDALKAAETLRSFVIRDLGTAVGHLDRLQHNIQAIGEYVDAQRTATNDISATLAALVDMLSKAGHVDPGQLVTRKEEILAEAGSDTATNKDAN